MVLFWFQTEFKLAALFSQKPLQEVLKQKKKPANLQINGYCLLPTLQNLNLSEVNPFRKPMKAYVSLLPCP